MARSGRKLSETGLYHVIIRGNNKSRLFHTKDDFNACLGILTTYLQKYPLKIYHYCLMTNHIHFLVWAGEIKLLSSYMHGVQRSYHHYYRKKYTWFGHLFQGRYRSLPIETEAYLMDCGRYIERNPVRAKLVADPKDWPYSSYRVYGYGAEDVLVTHSVTYKELARDPEDRQKLYREYVESTRPYEEVLDRELIGI